MFFFVCSLTVRVGWNTSIDSQPTRENQSITFMIDYCLSSETFSFYSCFLLQSLTHSLESPERLSPPCSFHSYLRLFCPARHRALKPRDKRNMGVRVWIRDASRAAEGSGDLSGEEHHCCWSWHFHQGAEEPCANKRLAWSRDSDTREISHVKLGPDNWQLAHTKPLQPPGRPVTVPAWFCCINSNSMCSTAAVLGKILWNSSYKLVRIQ